MSNRSLRLFGIALFCISGCNMFNNPFRDTGPSQVVLTHPSVEGYRAIEVAESKPLMRPHQEMTCAPNSGAVTHGPLYFEDPYEEKGSEDGKFAWTSEDYLHVFYWRGRFLLNAVFFPVSAVVQPPWRDVESDGNRPSDGPVTVAEFFGCHQAFDASPRK